MNNAQSNSSTQTQRPSRTNIAISLLTNRPPRYRTSRLLNEFDRSLASVRFQSRYGNGNWHETRQPAIITQLKEPVPTISNALTKNKPPRLRFGKYSYQPIATFRDAPKAFPAKPRVEGFSPSTEKASAAAAVVRLIQRNSSTLGDATLGRNVFTNFWADTSVVDSDPWGRSSWPSPSSSRDPEGAFLDDYIDIEQFLMERDIREELGIGIPGLPLNLFGSRNNNNYNESETGSALGTSRSGVSEYESHSDSEEEIGTSGSETENDQSRIEQLQAGLPHPSYFARFNELLRRREEEYRNTVPEPFIADSGTQTMSDEERALFERYYAQWDRETSSHRGSSDLFSGFWENIVPTRPQMVSTGTEAANFDSEQENEEKDTSEVSSGESRNSRPLRSNANQPHQQDSHTRTRSEVLRRMREMDFTTSGLMGEGDNNSAITRNFGLGSYPRRQRDDDPRSFLDSLDDLQSGPDIPNLEESDDEQEPSVFFEPSRASPDLTPNSLFDSFSEDLKHLTQEMQSSSGNTLPDEYFFEEDH